MEDVLFVSQEGASSSIGGTRSRATGVSARTTQAVLPNKRVADNERTTGSGGGDDDTVESILALCGPERDVPDTVAYNDAVYSRVNKDNVTKGKRSSMWSFVELYQAAADTEGHLVALCIVCHRLNESTKGCLAFLRKANNSNGVKHFEWAATRDLPTKKQLVHCRVMMYMMKHVTGGNRSRRLNEDNSIERFIKKERRSDHLRFVVMLVMSLSPHMLATNDYLRAFLAPLTNYTPPAPDTVIKHLVELYTYLVGRVRARLLATKQQMGGLPFAHVVSDLWSEKHRSNCFGTVIVRYVNPAQCTMEVVHLGVSLFIGRHDHANINRWLLGRLAYFGLDESDLCSTTTDSGANVRKAMLQLAAPWLPCFAHSLHNAVQYSLGSTGESGPQNDNNDADLVVIVRPDRSRNPRAKAVLAKMRKLLGHFNHSERSLAIFNRVAVGPSRELLTDVVTRWSSTYRAIARMYTLHARLAAFFSSAEVGTGPRKRRLSTSDWDRLRQIMGVLRSAFEVTTRAESSADPLFSLVSLVGSFRVALHSPTVLVPCHPGPPLAVGDAAVESYCAANPAELVFEVDNYLYPAEELCVREEPGKESLCEEAAKAVEVMRAQLDLRFFNKDDDTRNILKNDAVLRSCVISPCGLRLLQELARIVNVPDPYPHAVSSLRLVCNKFATTACPPPSNTPATSSDPPTRKRARSCLVDLTQYDEEAGADVAVSRVTLANNELDSYLQFLELNKKRDPLVFWAQCKAKFPTLYLVACSVLGAVASSAGAERDFSWAGNVMRKTRTRLLPRHLEMHCFIHDNVNLLPSPVEAVPALTKEEADKIAAEMPLAGRPQARGDEEYHSSDDE